MVLSLCPNALTAEEQSKPSIASSAVWRTIMSSLNWQNRWGSNCARGKKPARSKSDGTGNVADRLTEEIQFVHQRQTPGCGSTRRYPNEIPAHSGLHGSQPGVAGADGARYNYGFKEVKILRAMLVISRPSGSSRLPLPARRGGSHEYAVQCRCHHF